MERDWQVDLEEKKVLVEVSGRGDAQMVRDWTEAASSAKREQRRGVDPPAVSEVSEERLAGAGGPGVSEGDDSGIRDSLVDAPRLAVHAASGRSKGGGCAPWEADIVLWKHSGGHNAMFHAEFC
jgi:hypothetical protein